MGIRVPVAPVKNRHFQLSKEHDFALFYQCEVCKARLLIDHVEHQNNGEVRVWMKCPNSEWYHKHTEMDAVSFNGGSTFSFSPCRIIYC